jgi:phosphonate transport system ATP-binding protein
MILQLKGVSKIYPNGTQALGNVSIDVPAGQFLVILGPSGAGKSTLMRCVNRLVEPTSGEILFENRQIGGDLRVIRRQFGMVFQQFNLVKRLSVLTNVLTGRLGYRSVLRSLIYSFPESDKRIGIECLARVNMEHKAFQRADTLSGGEQQRVAIARALAQQPKVILADEPVASLDPKIARQVLTYLRQVAKELGITVLCNLHQVDYAREFAERVVGMSRGSVVFDGPASQLTEDILHRIYYREAEDKAA